MYDDGTYINAWNWWEREWIFVGSQPDFVHIVPYHGICIIFTALNTSDGSPKFFIFEFYHVRSTDMTFRYRSETPRCPLYQ